ncbi:hypothetical protein B0H14DRAFT_3861473 [Mycena olivaceomarginata]|nr:hypothetical protein B0H14DRAFT_3861473 [Mycena olivaceomarginata]
MYLVGGQDRLYAMSHLILSSTFIMLRFLPLLSRLAPTIPHSPCRLLPAFVPPSFSLPLLSSLVPYSPILILTIRVSGNQSMVRARARPLAQRTPPALRGHTRDAPATSGAALPPKQPRYPQLELDATLHSEAHAAVLRASVPGRGRTAPVSRDDEDGQTTTSTSTTRTAPPARLHLSTPATARTELVDFKHPCRSRSHHYWRGYPGIFFFLAFRSPTPPPVTTPALLLLAALVPPRGARMVPPNSARN